MDDNITLDEWQQKVLDAKGNVCLCSGRQVGKSTVVAIKASKFALENPNCVVLVTASVERQAYFLLNKILSFLEKNHKNMLFNKGKNRPTMTHIGLKNGSDIFCLPCGHDGHGIRGYTVNLLIVDEASFLNEAVWEAITPMLSVSGGKMILLSTPKGKGNYFHKCFSDDSFEKFHISAEDCPRHSKEFLDREKQRMTKLQYAQEYLGMFVDNLKQVYSDDLIKSCMTQKRRNVMIYGRNYYLGVDVARMGEDLSTFEIIDKLNKDNLIHVENITTSKTLLPDTFQTILNLDKKYDFKSIFIDDGGLGVGVFDWLLRNDQTKRKVIAINNADRPLDKEEKKKRRLIKEEIFNNLLMLMQSGKIKLLDDDEVFFSLKSVQYEITDEGRITYFGDNMHLADGLVRAAWCSNTKDLSIWLSSFKV